MYRSGKSIQEVATERGLTIDTISNHLLRYVDSGELDAHELVSEEIINKVRQFKTENPESEGCRPIYEALGGCASYNEIHFALRCL